MSHSLSQSFCHCIRGIRCSFWRPSLSEGEVWALVKGMVFAWISILICGNNINAQQAQASLSLSSFHSPTPWFTRWFYSYRMLAAQCYLPLFVQTESASPWLHVSVVIAVTHALLNKSQEVGNLRVLIKASGWSWVMLHVNVLHKTVFENFEISWEESWEEILSVIDAESSVEHLFFEGKPPCWEDYVSWR